MWLKKFNKFLTLFCSLLSVNFLYAENLLEVYLLARENDPIILQAKQTQLISSENLVIARAKFLPNVYFNGSQSYFRQRDTLGLLNSYNRTRANYNTSQYALNISQPIFQMVDWTEYSKTKKEVLSSLKKYENAEQELFLRVAEQYFAVLAAMDQLEASKAAKQAFSKRLEQATQQFKVGVTAITDVNEAQARLDTAKAKEIVDSNALNTEHEKLSQIIGKLIVNIVTLKNQVELVKPDPEDIELWIDKSRKNNLKLQSARYDVEAAHEAMRASSLNHLPTMGLNASVSNSKSMPPSVDKYHTKQIAINLQLPIFSGGAMVAATQAATFQTNIALQKLEAAYRDAESSTRIAYNTVLTQIGQVNALEQSVKSSAIALKATQAAFEVGTRTIVDVLNSQTDLLNAQKNYAQSRYEYILSGLKLKQATGSLCFADLEQINNLLDNIQPKTSNNQTTKDLSAENSLNTNNTENQNNVPNITDNNNDSTEINKNLDKSINN